METKGQRHELQDLKGDDGIRRQHNVAASSPSSSSDGASGPPPGTAPTKVEGANKKEISREVAISKCLFNAVDHVTDLVVLLDLRSRGLHTLFWVGLLLDLLPGPFTALQFYTLGQPLWRCAILVFHPVNFYAHTVAVYFLGKDTEAGKYSSQVAVYSREAQGLLEAPMQLIFTLTLICLRILPTPFETDNAPVLENSFGGRIRLSFYPALSVVFSFLMVMFNGMNSHVLTDDGNEEGGSRRSKALWLFFIGSTLIFRVHAWVFICSFLADFALAAIALILVANLGVILIKSSATKLESVLNAVYSTVVPTACSHAVNADGDSFRSSRSVIWHLTWAGNVMLVAVVAAVYLSVHAGWFDYNPAVRIRRGQLAVQLACSVALGLVSLVGAVAIYEGQQDEQPRKGPKLSIALWAILLLVSGLTGLASVKVNLGQETSCVISFDGKACGSEVGDAITLEGYYMGGDCLKDYHPEEDELFDFKGVSNYTLGPSLARLGDIELIEDLKPSSPHRGGTEGGNNKTLFLLPGEATTSIRGIVDTNCVPKKRGYNYTLSQFTRCGFAREMLCQQGFPDETLGNWVCLAHYHQFNTSKVTPHANSPVTDYGLFQVNGFWWCEEPAVEGVEPSHNGCSMLCVRLLDDDITDDSKCAKIIFGRHGFEAWNTWKTRCKGFCGEDDCREWLKDCDLSCDDEDQDQEENVRVQSEDT